MMKNIKKKLIYHLKSGNLIFIGKPVYWVVITLQLFFHRIADLFVEKGTTSTDDVLLSSDLTAIIKTFERPRVIKRLIKSIRRFYPELPIILVDDSKTPVKIPGLNTVVIPFDSGISAGRNKALSLVKTEFLLLLDDDFIFFNKTLLKAPLGKMKANPTIDIMGGEVIDLPFYKKIDYSKASIHPTDASPTMPPGSMIDGMAVLDKVPNFYIGRTESIKKVGWDEQIKRLDHADFFTRAKGVLTTVFNPKFKCLHARTLYNKKYMNFRNDIRKDQIHLTLKYYTKFHHSNTQ